MKLVPYALAAGIHYDTISAYISCLILLSLAHNVLQCVPAAHDCCFCCRHTVTTVYLQLLTKSSTHDMHTDSKDARMSDTSAAGLQALWRRCGSRQVGQGAGNSPPPPST